jgi:hypothetical protein
LIAGLFHSTHNAIVNPTSLVAVVALEGARTSNRRGASGLCRLHQPTAVGGLRGRPTIIYSVSQADPLAELLTGLGQGSAAIHPRAWVRRRNGAQPDQ